ncbi:hypothetical protein GQ42DRAFT_87397 [Ramicandelaber brevisporus]|nr:hypothetical protein GQ42DRAFT_87397 [Ramicandelaber brevisporus]
MLMWYVGIVCYCCLLRKWVDVVCWYCVLVQYGCIVCSYNMAVLCARVKLSYYVCGEYSRLMRECDMFVLCVQRECLLVICARIIECLSNMFM